MYAKMRSATGRSETIQMGERNGRNCPREWSRNGEYQKLVGVGKKKKLALQTLAARVRGNASSRRIRRDIKRIYLQEEIDEGPVRVVKGGLFGNRCKKV
jgi:hypothetical protein